jgi:hypothetical protein
MRLRLEGRGRKRCRVRHRQTRRLRSWRLEFYDRDLKYLPLPAEISRAALGERAERGRTATDMAEGPIVE